MTTTPIVSGVERTRPIGPHNHDQKIAARSASGRNLIDFLAEHRSANADGHYGNGNAQATGGALRIADWNGFVTGLGMSQAQVPA